VFWMTICLFNSAYTSFWDIKMDWGLMKSDSKYTLLRDELVFYRWVYYVAIPINIILRFSWTLSIVTLPINNLLLGILVALLEAYRRIQWNFFRLENEHLNNCGQYRAIKEIPLPFPPTNDIQDETDIKTEILLSDEEEGESILSSKAHNLEMIASHHAPAIMIPIAHHSSTGRPQASSHPERSSFYGRRDFENKHDDTSDINVVVGSVNNNNHTKHSTLDNVLTRIKSLRNSEQSDESEVEYDDEDDDDDDDGEEEDDDDEDEDDDEYFDVLEN
ncbi:MAG: EXS family-domain-containing protein, partial [Benjaminiella poitrasii]